MLFRSTEGNQFAAFFQEEVDGKAGNAGHGRDGFPLLLAFADENGLDEVVNGQGVFAGEAAAEIVLAVAAFAGERVGLSGDVHDESIRGKGRLSYYPPGFFTGQTWFVTEDAGSWRFNGKALRSSGCGGCDFSRDTALNPAIAVG